MLIALPLVALIDLKLRDIGRVTMPDKGSRTRSVTNIGLVMLCLTVALIVVGLVVGSIPLLLAAGVIVLYFVVDRPGDLAKVAAAPITVETLQFG